MNLVSFRMSARSAYPAVALALCVALSGLAGCQRIKDAIGMGADQDGSGAMSESANVAATDEPAPLLAEPAELPTGALDLMPGDADAYVLFDVGTVRDLARRFVPGATDAMLRELIEQVMTEADIPSEIAARFDLLALDGLAVGVWASAPGAVVVVDSAAITNPPEDGAPAEALGAGVPVMIAMRGAHAVLGFGPPFIAATSADADGARPSSRWPVGWDALPEGSVFAVVAPDVASLPAEVRDGLPDGLEITAMSFGYRLDGAFGIAIATPDDAMVRAALGSLQTSMTEALGEAAGQIPPEVGNWAAYLELAGRALWSQLSVERNDGVTVVSMGAARCGQVNLASLALAGAVASMFEARAFDPTATYVQMNQPIAEGCPAMPGPQPNLPTDLIRLAPATAEPDTYVTLVDLGAIIRTQLPTGLGLLPFALRAEDINEALGPRPLGLNGIADPNARGGGWMTYADNNQVSVVVLPQGVFDVVPNPPSDRVVVAPNADYGVTVSSIGYDDRINAAVPTAGPWADAVAALAPDTAFAMIGSANGMNRAYDDVLDAFESDALRAMFESADVVTIGLTANLEPAVYITLRGDARAIGERAHADLSRALREQARTLPEAERAFALANVDALVDAIHMEAPTANTVRVTFTVPGVPSSLMAPIMLGGGFALIGARTSGSDVYDMDPTVAVGTDPNMMWLTAQATAFYQSPAFGADGKVLPNRFPRSVAATPSISALTTACASGAPGVSWDPATWAAPGWTDMQVQSAPFAWSNLSASYAFESSGVGPDARFTLTGVYDRDCDGVLAVTTLTGAVVDGVVTLAMPVETNPGE